VGVKGDCLWTGKKGSLGKSASSVYLGNEKVPPFDAAARKGSRTARRGVKLMGAWSLWGLQKRGMGTGKKGSCVGLGGRDPGSGGLNVAGLVGGSCGRGTGMPKVRQRIT